LKHKYRELKSFPVKTEKNKNKNKRKILLLGSSHGREIGPTLQENLGTKFDIRIIFKPNAPLAKVVEDIGKLGKGLTKQDNIIVGGSGQVIIQLKMASASLQRGHQTPVWGFSTSLRGMTSHG
jgi:hypothetical protein